MALNFTNKKFARKFDASEWEASKPIYFKNFNFFEALAVDDLFERYRLKTSTVDEKLKASFEMLKMALIDENGDAVLTDADFEAIKNAPAAPIIRAWCYATNPDYRKTETIQI